MSLRTTESVEVPAPPERVFPLVAELDRYPSWLPLVHAADVDPSAASAWLVEIRARVGPFARSKRLRMERTSHEHQRSATFERAETDGRRHARWVLRVELTSPADDVTRVTMHLSYDGALWTGGLLDRVLDEEIRRGRDGLAALVSAEPTR